jgi:hypothetical protein
VFGVKLVLRAVVVVDPAHPAEGKLNLLGSLVLIVLVHLAKRKNVLSHGKV